MRLWHDSAIVRDRARWFSYERCTRETLAAYGTAVLR